MLYRFRSGMLRLKILLLL